MRKIMVIAAREYQAAVKTKSFVISLILMPVMIGGGILMELVLKNQVDITAKRFAVVDRSPGQGLYPVLEAAARERNDKSIFDPATGKQVKPVFTLERVEP